MFQKYLVCLKVIHHQDWEIIIRHGGCNTKILPVCLGNYLLEVLVLLSVNINPMDMDLIRW